MIEIEYIGMGKIKMHIGEGLKKKPHNVTSLSSL